MRFLVAIAFCAIAMWVLDLKVAAQAAPAAKDQARNVDDPSQHVGDEVAVKYAKAVEEVANLIWQRALQAERLVPGSVDQAEVARLELKYQRAKLVVNRAELDKRIAELDHEINDVEARKTLNRKR